jgi:hypothetical protein
MLFTYYKRKPFIVQLSAFSSIVFHTNILGRRKRREGGKEKRMGTFNMIETDI